jgi:4-hydroxybenzoate polyprenyltransferase
MNEPAPGFQPLALVKVMRPKQWIKNGLLGAALMFSGQFLNVTAIGQTAAAVVAFSLLSSTGYVLNDYLDREADRRHPKKRFRPIAAGTLPEAVALVEMGALLVGGVAISAWLGPWFLASALAYLATTVSYSLWLKHIVILDVMFLASCYVWRAVAGAAAIGVAVSPWLFLCTAFLALFIGFGKRRAELTQLGHDLGTRKNLADYSPAVLDQYQSIVTGSTVLSYSLYAVLGPTPWMTLTIPFVLYALFRYIWLVEIKGEGAAPDETFLQDVPILVTVALYILVAVIAMLLPHGGAVPSVFGAS